MGKVGTIETVGAVRTVGAVFKLTIRKIGE